MHGIFKSPAEAETSPPGAGAERPRRPRARSGTNEGDHSVVANETLGGRSLLEAVRKRIEQGDVRFVLCVPQNRPRAGLVIYDDAVFDAAQVRVDLALEFVHAEGIEAIGEVGDPDPYTATIDAVREYRPGRDHHLDLPGDPLGLAAPRPDRSGAPGHRACPSSTSSPTPTPKDCRST